MNFLNSGIGYKLFNEEKNKKAYIDKSMLIDVVWRYAIEVRKYICITRPRRFGKTIAANMIAAFFDESTGEKSRLLFEGMEFGKLKDVQEKEYLDKEDPSLCWPQQGKHKVIRINMIDLISDKTESYRDFRKTLDRRMLEDLNDAYPGLPWRDLDLDNVDLSELLMKTGDEFIFVIDEWDSVFEKRFMTIRDKEDYLEFLKNLLKDKAYVRFAYMTGILPIAKYSSGSPLNMFHEFSSFMDSTFYPYFGLTEKEIGILMQKKGYVKPMLSELAAWYDGYVRKDGVHVFNPASVARALAEGVCDDYWTGTGPMNEVRDIIQRNVQDLRGDIIRMAGGETLEVKLSGFSVEKSDVTTRDEILSAMVVYGFLSYSEGKLRIPNHELMLKYQQALASQEMGLKQTMDESTALLQATLGRDHKQIAKLIEELHEEKIPFFKYNDENSLACIVTVGYLAALDRYKISREDKAGKGYADFVFEPIKHGDMPMILELKYNHSAKNALKCIHEKGYIQRFKDYRQVLLVGINYSSRTKRHTCLTEIVEQFNA